ncbi:MAG: YfhO family protein [Deltaproteobacteria bacterium]|nr:YfhO family protein [Deltaproteobacteria bacterium]
MSQHIKALFLYILAISIIHGPVVFLGNTLSPALMQPHGLVDGWPLGYEGRTPVNSFNVDLATPAYYEWPANKTAGDMWKKGEVPLWNPYQGGGAPFAADYSTRVFFPYQILEDVSPPEIWDFFLIGRPLVAGFFTYLFLNAVGLSFSAAFLGGILYMFSGSFTWFINLEQYANAAMTLPVLMHSIELLLKNKGARNISYLGVATALAILSGQPEAALYILAIGAAYFIFRAAGLSKAKEFLRLFVKGLGGLLLGLMLAMPLILIFIEYAGLGYNLHPGNGGAGLQHIENWKKVFSIFAPSATEVPAHPSLLPEALSAYKDAAGVEGFFRVFATKGAWDYVGGYAGIIAVYLGLAGLFTSIVQKNRRLIGQLIFFLSFAAIIMLKNFGVRPFLWLGHIPLFDRVWSPRWAGPSWVFALSVAGALGWQALYDVKAAAPARLRLLDTLKKQARAQGWPQAGREQYVVEGNKAQRAAAAAYIALLSFLAFGPLKAAISIALNSESYFVQAIAGHAAKAIVSGNIVPIVVLTAGLIISLYYLRTGKGVHALIPLAALELWWDVPRGYGEGFLLLKFVLFAIGLIVVFLAVTEKKGAAIAAAVMFLAAFLYLDSSSPYGLAKRHAPFNEPPYVSFLKANKDEFRVMGGSGVLFPNYAGSAGLKDLRYIYALAPGNLIQFRYKNLETPVQNAEMAASALWFTGMPEHITENFTQEKGLSYGFSYKGIEEDIAEKLPYYSFMGVRFMLMPSSFANKEQALLKAGLKLVYDKEIRIYENLSAFPRAFVTYPADAKAGSIIAEKALIREYRANSVAIEAEAQKDGLLVFTDVYWPGWKAYVNGVEAKIMPVEGIARGVYIKKGRNEVLFSYMPEGFKKGLMSAGASVVIMLALAFSKTRP